MRTTQDHSTSNQIAILLLAIVLAIPTAAVTLFMAGIIFFGLDDTYYPASKTINYSWTPGPSPKIEVDLEEGYISVVQSIDGTVKARLTLKSVTKESQEASDSSLNNIVITAEQKDGSIKIRTTNPGKTIAIHPTADIELSVPPDSSINLLTDHGYIYIGKMWGSNGQIISSPVALNSVRARDLGESYIGIEADIAPRPSRPATQLDLESRHGSIVISGDNLLVDAKAESGGVEFTGRLAPRLHHFETGKFEPHPDSNWRLEKGIRLNLPADSSFEVDASGRTGNVSSQFQPETMVSHIQKDLRAMIGVDPRVKLELCSEDGSIEIRKEAESKGSLK